jgi:predicted nucleic acid-binding protein
VSFLLDTNIVSELRRGEAASPSVVEWFDRQPVNALFLSVITIGEIRQGIEQVCRSDPRRPQHSIGGWTRWSNSTRIGCSTWTAK